MLAYVRKKLYSLKIGGNIVKNQFKILIFVLLASFSLATSVYAFKTQFFTSVIDLPLMSGFVELEDSAVIFDKPSGRIVETIATGTASKEKAMNFYLQSLPQLGWEAIGEGRYVREDELLKLEFSKNADKTTIHVTLTPTKG